MTVRFHIWDLAQYNAGNLVGGWIDLEPGMDAEEIQEAINKLLTPDGEEWLIGDHEGMGPFHSEHMSADDLEEVADSLAECERRGIQWDLFCAWCEHTGEGLDSHAEFEDSFQGFYDCFRYYSDELFDECYLPEVPDSVRGYIDYDAFARDLEMDYTVIDWDRGVAVFTNY